MQPGIRFSERSSALRVLSTIAVGAALIGGLLVARAGIARTPSIDVASPPADLAPEWRMERKTLNFNHMFRESGPSHQRSDWIGDERRR